MKDLNLVPCIRCKAPIRWKGMCLRCYNSTIGNKQIPERTFSQKQPEEKNKPSVSKYDLFENFDYCDGCENSDCEGCVVVTKNLFKVTQIPNHIHVTNMHAHAFSKYYSDLSYCLDCVRVSCKGCAVSDKNLQTITHIPRKGRQTKKTSGTKNVEKF